MLLKILKIGIVLLVLWGCIEKYPSITLEVNMEKYDHEEVLFREIPSLARNMRYYPSPHNNLNLPEVNGWLYDKEEEILSNTYFKEKADGGTGVVAAHFDFYKDRKILRIEFADRVGERRG